MSGLGGRWFDGKACALVGCGRGGALSGGCAAVAIATDERLRRRLVGKKGGGAAPLVKWVANGRQALHRECWDLLQNSVRRGSGRTVEAAMVSEAQDTAEYFDSDAAVRAAAGRVCALLRAGRDRPLAVFTGAGVSETAGIPTYRGTAGIDTKAALSHGEEARAEEEEEEDEGTDYAALQPTPTHRAIAQLEAKKLVRYVVSQNCDNLHRKGGTCKERLTEVHGNVFVEYCELCGTEYTRSYAVDAFSTDCHQEAWFVECPDCKWNHFTGRKCSKTGCKGRLRDTIVNFGDPLHATVLGGLDKATKEFAMASVCLAMGSSLSVCPANSLPLLPEHLVIVNLQNTELDDKAVICVKSTSDAFMPLLLEALDQPPSKDASIPQPPPASEAPSAESNSSSKRSRSKTSRARDKALKELIGGIEYGREKEEERRQEGLEHQATAAAAKGRGKKKGKKQTARGRKAASSSPEAARKKRAKAAGSAAVAVTMVEDENDEEDDGEYQDTTSTRARSSKKRKTNMSSTGAESELSGVTATKQSLRRSRRQNPAASSSACAEDNAAPVVGSSSSPVVIVVDDDED